MSLRKTGSSLEREMSGNMDKIGKKVPKNGNVINSLPPEESCVLCNSGSEMTSNRQTERL